MKKPAFFAALLCLLVLQCIPSVFAQDAAEPAPPPKDMEETPATAEPARAGQEVEINEDTYRQFMELKDANRQGDMMPEDVFKPGSGLQKLDKLPEESQKHLRNELREIIVQGDPWQPGDEEAEYPYVPSPAAGKDPALQKQEQEAWGELVDSYNQREEQIYENATGTRAARATENGNGENPGEGGKSTDGSGRGNEGIQGQEASQDGSPDQSDTAGTYSPGAVNDPNSTSASGVSQNAMEFLQGRGQAGGSGALAGDSGQSPTPANSGNQGQAQSQAAQQGTAEQEDGASAGTQNPAATTATSTAGASQNALEFLQRSSAQSADVGGSDTGPVADGQDNGQETGPGSEQGEGQSASQGDAQAADDQQSETVRDPVSIVIPGDDTAASNVEAEGESTEGISQNALEYLTDDNAQTSDVDGQQADTGTPPGGTLNIQDLLNAQGVGSAAGANPANPAAEEEKPADETKTDKDGGGR